MTKYVLLVVLTLLLFLVEVIFEHLINFHDQYYILVLFFFFQSLILFRIEQSSGEENQVQLRMVSIVVRMLSALIFALVMFFIVRSDLRLFFIEFIVLYLVFMTFEITLALANLRRN